MKRAFILFTVLCVVSPISAQSTLTPGDCGYGLPCGPLPWNLPSWPDLITPTFEPNLYGNPSFYTPTPTITPSPTVVNTPTSTPTAVFDAGALENQMQTLQAIMSGTDIPIQNLQGTPVNLDEAINDLTSNAVTFWGYVRGFSGSTFGQIGPLIAFSLFAFGVVALTKFTSIGLPILIAIWGIIRKTVQLVLDFIPL